MSDVTLQSPLSVEPGPAPHASHKGLILLVLGISQLMIVLDATIVNVALPSIQIALSIESYGDLQWIVTGYTLAFGGFLLLGGKLADRFGRRLVFMIGAGLFGLASLLGGFASDLSILIAARGLQGLGGALMAPAALSLVTVVFEEGRERDRAFGVWAAISAGGAAVGLILGGLLTQYASWRWVLYVNAPIAIFAVWGVLRYVSESRDERARGFDVPGAILVTGGLMILVYALVNGNTLGWGSTQTLVTLSAAILLLISFIVLQLDDKTGGVRRVGFDLADLFLVAAGILALGFALARGNSLGWGSTTIFVSLATGVLLIVSFIVTSLTRRSPLLPLQLFRSRWVTGANLGGFLVVCGLFSVFYFVVLWMQQINGWTPIQSGLAALPITVFIVVGAAISSVLLNRIGPRPLAAVGPVIAAAGLLYIGLRLEPDSRYVADILPGFIMLAIGMGIGFVALTSSAVSGIQREYAGIASAVLNAGQQIGGSVGLALLLAVSIGVTNAALPPGVPFDPAATVEGWGVALVVGAGLIFLAGVVMGLVIPRGRIEAAPQAGLAV